MYISALVNITSRAWALPILSSLHEGVPGRQAPLLAATGAGRTSFSQSVDHLIQIGLLERNPGYGHPLRPEFRLTQHGAAAARFANQILSATSEDNQDLLRRSWTLPVLATLHELSHFNEIRRNLLTITDRALSQSLRMMEERDWVQRDIDDGARPPRATYHPINTDETITAITGPVIVFKTGSQLRQL